MRGGGGGGGGGGGALGGLVLAGCWSERCTGGGEVVAGWAAEGDVVWKAVAGVVEARMLEGAVAEQQEDGGSHDGGRAGGDPVFLADDAAGVEGRRRQLVQSRHQNEQRKP